MPARRSPHPAEAFGEAQVGAGGERYLLYDKTGCSYCIRVLEFAKESGITFELRNREAPGVIDELIARGGKRQFPYLVDREKEIEMYESEDIVRYLKKNLG